MFCIVTDTSGERSGLPRAQPAIIVPPDLNGKLAGSPNRSARARLKKSGARKARLRQVHFCHK